MIDLSASPRGTLPQLEHKPNHPWPLFPPIRENNRIGSGSRSPAMSDYYHHFLSSMAGVGVQPPQQAANANFDPQGAPLQLQQPLTTALAGAPANPYQSLGHFTGFPEPVMFNAPKSQRSRRKSAPVLDHIKHRRTRSGCYTCRSRRVKVIATCVLWLCGANWRLTYGPPIPSATRPVPFAKVRPCFLQARVAVMLTLDRV